MDRSAPDGRHGLVLVIMSVLAVAALHLLVRGAISDSLITLDALENVNSQTWQLVYKADAPPLFNWLHIPFVAVLGPDAVGLKDMESGEQKTVTIDTVMHHIRGGQF